MPALSLGVIQRDATHLPLALPKDKHKILLLVEGSNGRVGSRLIEFQVE